MEIVKSKDLFEPECKTELSSAYDLKASLSEGLIYRLKPKETKMFDCEVSLHLKELYERLKASGFLRKMVLEGGLEVYETFEGTIVGRSSLNKKGIFVPEGTIDLDFDKPMKVMLHNSTDKDFTITHGDSVAQLKFQILLKFNTKGFIQRDTIREGGFGHTGK